MPISFSNIGQDLPERLIIFDGYCKLCDGTVQFLIKRDSKKLFKFSNLQSQLTQELQKQNKESFQNVDSIIYLKDQKLYTKSTAVLEILKDLAGVWKVFYAFIILPKFIRDAFYDLIAKYRYKVFGKYSQCMVPSKVVLDRFV